MNRLEKISSITKEAFLEKWIKAEQYNSNHGRHDQNSLDRIKAFSNKELIISFVEISSDNVFNEIIIPYHAGKDHFFKTSSGGNSLQEFTSSYSFRQIGENINDTCSKSIQYHIDFFKSQKDAGQPFVEGVFMYCTKDVELSPDVNSKKGPFLYAGSFHQFAAYGLFVKQFGRLPLRLYVCNNVL